MSAWDDEDGSPRDHVARFHPNAATSAAATRPSPGLPTGTSTSRVPIVWATPTPSSAPTTLSAPASGSATRAVSVALDRDVATAFDASWNPFIQANASASRTTTTRNASGTSALLDADRLEGVRHLFERVDHPQQGLGQRGSRTSSAGSLVVEVMSARSRRCACPACLPSRVSSIHGSTSSRGRPSRGTACIVTSAARTTSWTRSVTPGGGSAISKRTISSATADIREVHIRIDQATR